MTTGLRTQSIVPRGLKREEAAAYVGVGVTKFDEMVDDGRMPKPKRVDARVIWDRFRLDVAFDALPNDAEPPASSKWRDVAV